MIKQIIAAIFVMISVMSWADTFEEGVVAFDKGDCKKALEKFTPLAKQGNADAQYNLGYMYYNGNGVNQNFTEAKRWMELAAKQGDLGAKLYLGVMYDKGQGIEQNYSLAVRWYTKAAEKGNAYAMYNLGLFYENGTGVVQDSQAAIKWYTQAAEQKITPGGFKSEVQRLPI
jgi:TPR repeat protein